MLAIAASSTRIVPARAFVLIVAGAAAGPLVFGRAVAQTTGAGIADFHGAGAPSLFAAIAGALAAVGVTYAARVPTSLSAALFSSMVGALYAGPGAAAIRWSGVGKVATAMTGSVAIGFAAGALAYALLAAVLARVHRPVAERIVSLQFATVVLLAMGYGANDMEKSMGLLAAATSAQKFGVPLWTLAITAGGFAVGLAFGGARVARTVGGKLFVIRSPHALAAETAAAATVIGAAVLGGPLSTTDTSASALVGVGAAANPRTVRWRAVREIGLAWVVTIPAALVGGALAELIVRSI